jgi:8-oxo-dGTP pyrophosphatase MutT (NUDIX family)
VPVAAAHAPLITLAQVRHALAGYAPRAADAPLARLAAVSLLLVEGAGGVELLFIRRAERADDPWSGQVAFPGGRRDPGDLDLLATAVRETREETGVDLAGAERLGVLDDLVPTTPTLPPVLVRPFVFALDERPALAAERGEVARAFWVALARLATREVRQELVLTLRGVERTFPAYRVGEDVIWGLTERILTPFLRLVGAL